jgi:hypothetical protein
MVSTSACRFLLIARLEILPGELNVHLSPEFADQVTVLEPGQSMGEVSIIDHQPIYLPL